MTVLETAQLLGSLGEFLGAIAVVATLVYLAVQVRQTRALVANQVHQSSFALQAQYLQMIGGSLQVARVMSAGRHAHAELSDAEQLQFSSVTSLGLNIVEHSYRQPGIAKSADEVEELCNLIVYLLDHAGGRAYWEDHRGLFTARFAAWVDGVLRDRDQTR